MANDRIFVSIEHSGVHIDAQGKDGDTVFRRTDPPKDIQAIRAEDVEDLNPDSHPWLSSLAVRLVQELARTGMFSRFTFSKDHPWKIAIKLAPRNAPYSFDELEAVIRPIYAQVMQRKVDISQMSCKAKRRWRTVTGALTLRSLRRRRRAAKHVHRQQPNDTFRDGIAGLLEDAADSAADSSKPSNTGRSSYGSSSGCADGCTDGCDPGCDGCDPGCDGCGGCD